LRMILIYKYNARPYLSSARRKRVNAPFISGHDVKFVDYSRNGG
jgi:hypothetical protein